MELNKSSCTHTNYAKTPLTFWACKTYVQWKTCKKSQFIEFCLLYENWLKCFSVFVCVGQNIWAWNVEILQTHTNTHTHISLKKHVAWNTKFIIFCIHNEVERFCHNNLVYDFTNYFWTQQNVVQIFKR